MPPSLSALKIKRAKSKAQVGTGTPEMPEPVFARHETFAPRYGWAKKGFDAVVEDSSLFGREDAALRLGVGKNMARSIRYWTLATGILKESDGGGARSSSALEPTTFGLALLGNDGWDPFLEDLGSLWLLHWQLLRENGMATAWRYAFHEFALGDFTVDDLASSLEQVARRRYPTARLAPSSLRKDAVCIAQMYAGSTHSREMTEESIRSPFAQLELLGHASSTRHLMFRIGDKPGLSAALVGGLCVDFIGAHGSSRSLPFATLLRGLGGPGLALRLSEGALYGHLERAVHLHPQLRLDDTAGVIQLSVLGTPSLVASELFASHFAATVATSGAR